MLSALLLLVAAAPSGWAEILEGRVNGEGLVDYRAIAEHDLAKLDAYLETVAKREIPSEAGEALGIMADAYNALVVRAVIRERFPRSVLDVKGFFSDRKHRAFGRELTLDQLEKELIAPRGSPLHHFLLVCGAVGCPVLERRPFAGDDAKARAEAAARRYLRTPRGAVRAGTTLKLSKIFDWYAKDFGGPAGVRTFVAARLDGALPEQLDFLDYNWTLNNTN